MLKFNYCDKIYLIQLYIQLYIIYIELIKRHTNHRGFQLCATLVLNRQLISLFSVAFVWSFFFWFGCVTTQGTFRMSAVASNTCILTMCVSVCLMNLSLNFKNASLNSARLLLHYTAIFRRFFYSIMYGALFLLSLSFFLFHLSSFQA